MVILGACSSRILVPLTYRAQTDNNTALISEYDSVSVMVQNIAVKGGYMVFDMEVSNQSDRPIEVIPEHICYYASPGAFQPVDSTDDVHVVTLLYQNEFNYKEQAMRPGEVEAYFLKRLRVKQGVGVVLLLAGAGLVIHDAVQDEQDISQQEWTKSDAKKAVTRDVLTAASLVAIDVAGESLEASAYQDHVELRYLPDELFPQKDIEPGHSFRGKVCFLKREAHKYYRMIIPIGNADYVFDFRKPTPEEKMKLRAQ